GERRGGAPRRQRTRVLPGGDGGAGGDDPRAPRGRGVAGGGVGRGVLSGRAQAPGSAAAFEMCDPGAVRRALALSLVTSAACASGGTRLLEGFGQALVAAALIGVVVLAAGLAVYAWLWVRLLRRTRDPAAGAAATR